MTDKKILLVDPLSFEGPGNYDYMLCSELRKLGANIDVVGMRNFPVEDNKCQFGVYRYFADKFKLKNRLSKAFFYSTSLIRIFFLVVFRKYKILHFEFFLYFPLDFIFLKLAKHILDVKIVYTANDVIPLAGRSGNKKFLQAIYLLCDAVVVHSHFAKKQLAEYVPEIDEKIEVIHHGNYISFCNTTSRDTAKDELGIEKKRNVLLFYGAIRKNKGLKFLLEAMPGIVKNHPNVLLIIAGLPLQIDFNALYGKTLRDIEQHLLLDLSFISKDKEMTYFSAADIVLVPYTEVYTSGVLILANSYRRCAIASNIGGLPEIVKHGETGFLVNPADPNTITETVCEIFSKGKDYLDRIGEKAFEHMKCNFSWEESAIKTKKIYDNLMQTRSEKL